MPSSIVHHVVNIFRLKFIIIMVWEYTHMNYITKSDHLILWFNSISQGTRYSRFVSELWSWNKLDIWGAAFHTDVNASSEFYQARCFCGAWLFDLYFSASINSLLFMRFFYLWFSTVLLKRQYGTFTVVHWNKNM